MNGGKSASQPTLLSRFDVAVSALLVTEGGLVANQKDPGGITQYGISLRFLIAEGAIHPNPALLDINHDGTLDGRDVLTMTSDQARAIYRKCFWDAAHLGTLPAPIDAMMLDQCVNMGPGTATRLLKQSLHMNRVSGPIDDATDVAIAQAIKTLGAASVVSAYKVAARVHYHAIIASHPKLACFEAGWDARVDRLGDV